MELGPQELLPAHILEIPLVSCWLHGGPAWLWTERQLLVVSTVQAPVTNDNPTNNSLPTMLCGNAL